jgi:hypothetical protein
MPPSSDLLPPALLPWADALRAALRAQGQPGLAATALEALPDKGLAHVHLRLTGTGLLARLPKQSQLGLGAADHLAYEAACFARAQPGGHTPRLHATVAPTPALPLGALLVDEIVGRPAQLPRDLGALVDALASLHALPLPPAHARTPLRDAPDPLIALRDEIDTQAAHLDAAGLDGVARARIDAERRAFDALCAGPARPRRTLIAFDGHPGNFIVDDAGRAWLVDLEKARYGFPALDLAHATLYTSTTWDVASHAVLGTDDLLAACERWAARVQAGADERRWIVPLRRAMWLWSVTWCAKWRALSAQAPHGGDAGGEDWSSALSDDALIAHVRERVDHYLSREIVERVCDEADALAQRLER